MPANLRSCLKVHRLRTISFTSSPQVFMSKSASFMIPFPTPTAVRPIRRCEHVDCTQALELGLLGPTLTPQVYCLRFRCIKVEDIFKGKMFASDLDYFSGWAAARIIRNRSSGILGRIAASRLHLKLHLIHDCVAENGCE